MTIIMDLDEHSETALAGELNMREAERNAGKCDYCHRRPSTRDCRFSHRHHDPRILDSIPCGTCHGGGYADGALCSACRGTGIQRQPTLFDDDPPEGNE